MLQLEYIKKSNKYIRKSNSLIRKIFLSSKEQFITLEEEIEMLSLYLDLEKLRLGHHFRLNLKCDIPSKVLRKIKLPAMFIYPYIGNAIMQGTNKIKIHFNLKDRYLTCVIENIGAENKNNLNAKRIHSHSFFSVEATKNRIGALNNLIDRNIKLEKENLLNGKKDFGTKTTLFFPV